mmetsp:Transcript_14775/g.22258  ORF Transcript_14775/g.22258 Transcript_14775/m.22258 type:complete len:194 (+) Transcript_14775:90-671(+)
MSTQACHLFGGAIVCTLPTSYEDISVYRTVPDHQEVYVDKTSNTSVIVEILSRQDVSDASAPQFFFDDLVEFNRAKASEVYYSKVDVSSSCIPSIDASKSRCLLIGRQEVEKDHRLDNVLVFMVLLRLPEKETDILITMNSALDSAAISLSPSALSSPDAIFSSTPEPSLAHNEQVFKEVVTSFKIQDWGLFC